MERGGSAEIQSAVDRAPWTASTRQHTVPSVPNLMGTLYTIRVIAIVSNADDGLPSSGYTESVPDKNSGNRAPDGQWKLDFASTRQHTVPSGSTTTYTIPNLIAGTLYTIRVIAIVSNSRHTESDNSRTSNRGAVSPETVGRTRWQMPTKCSGNRLCQHTPDRPLRKHYNLHSRPHRPRTAIVTPGCRHPSPHRKRQLPDPGVSPKSRDCRYRGTRWQMPTDTKCSGNRAPRTLPAHASTPSPPEALQPTRSRTSSPARCTRDSDCLQRRRR